MSGIEFSVHGMPVAQGSKKVIKGHLIEMADARLRTWRQDVASVAADEMKQNSLGPFAGPVAVRLAFSLPRPRNHFGTGRNAEILKGSAPSYPAVHPDLDKLARSVLDALTGYCFYDDKQVVALDLAKWYGPPGMEAQVMEVQASAAQSVQ